MKFYNAIAEIDILHEKMTDAQSVTIVDALAGYHPAVGRGPFAQAEVVISLPAESLRQATTTALALFADALPDREIVTLAVLTTDEFDRRNGLEPIGDLISVSEAAAELGVSRQRVLQRIENGRLPAQRVGTSWILTRGAVLRDIDRKELA